MIELSDTIDWAPGIDPKGKDEDGLPLIDQEISEQNIHQHNPALPKVRIEGKTKEETEQNLLRALHFIATKLDELKNT